MIMSGTIGPNATKLCLEVPAPEFRDGGKVYATPCLGHPTQTWEFDRMSLRGWRIINNPDRRDRFGYQMCLDYYPADKVAGAQINVYRCHNLYAEFPSERPVRDSQRWNWHPREGMRGLEVISPSFVQTERYRITATCLGINPNERISLAKLVSCATPFETNGAPVWMFYPSYPNAR